MKSAVAADEGWRATLDGAETITLPLAYEELAADLPGAVGRVFAHVGIDPGPPIPPPGLQKQAGDWSRRWSGATARSDGRGASGRSATRVRCSAVTAASRRCPRCANSRISAWGAGPGGR